MRRLLALTALVAGPLVYLARRRGERRERVSLYYDDGSMLALERDAPGVERLLRVTHDALA
jgi:hypothetical protein